MIDHTAKKNSYIKNSLIVEYIIMEWTMPTERRICRICRRVLTCMITDKARAKGGGREKVSVLSKTKC